MRILISADWHLSSYKNTYMDMQEQIAAGLQEFRKIVKDTEPDMIIVAGDVFHDKVLLYKNAKDLFVDEFMNPMRDYKNPICLIAGNHDISSYGCLLDNELVSSNPNISIVYNTTASTGSCVMVPYNLAQLEDMQEMGYDEDVNMLISHFGLNEARLNNGLSRISPIRLTQLNMYKLVILGHYHTPQSIVSNIKGRKCCGVYAGSLVPMSWNDKNEKKRCILVDTDKINKDPELAYESIPIQSKYIKEFREYVIDKNISASKVEEIEKNALADAKNGNVTRVVVSSIPEGVDNNTIETILDKLRDLNVGIISLTDAGMFQQTGGDNNEMADNRWLGKSFNELCEQYLEFSSEKDAAMKTLQEILEFDTED